MWTQQSSTRKEVGVSVCSNIAHSITLAFKSSSQLYFGREAWDNIHVYRSLYIFLDESGSTGYVNRIFIKSTDLETCEGHLKIPLKCICQSFSKLCWCLFLVKTRIWRHGWFSGWATGYCAAYYGFDPYSEQIFIWPAGSCSRSGCLRKCLFYVC